MTVPLRRGLALLCAALWVASFFLPVVRVTLIGESTLWGYEAFQGSLAGFLELPEWELDDVPLLLAWLANLGAVIGLALALRGRPARRWIAWTALGLALLALGPLPLEAKNLEIGYYVWAGAVLGAAALGLAAAAPHRENEAG